MDKIIRKFIEAADVEIKSIDAKTRTIWHTITKEVPDRMGDIIEIDGFGLRNFKRKPSVIYGHDYQGKDPVPVFAENIGFRREGKELVAGTKWLDSNAVSPKLRDLINDLWYLNTKKLLGWSVGFLPNMDKTENITDADGRVTGRRFKEAELLEYSCVIIPCHQDAINDDLFAKGIIDGFKDRKLVAEDLEQAPAGFKSLAEFLAQTAEEPAPEARPYPSEHSCRLNDPGKYEKFRRGTRDHKGKEYSIIFGKLKGENTWEEQAYRYAKDVWTAAEAQAHCKDHGGSFEAAKGVDAPRCPECSGVTDEELDLSRKVVAAVDAVIAAIEPEVKPKAKDPEFTADELADLIKRAETLLDERISTRQKIIAFLKEKLKKLNKE